MTNTFKCAVCKETFNKAWSDEEALEDLEKDFPDVAPEDCDLVCEDCYKKLFPSEETPPTHTR